MSDDDTSRQPTRPHTPHANVDYTPQSPPRAATMRGVCSHIIIAACAGSLGRVVVNTHTGCVWPCGLSGHAVVVARVGMWLRYHRCSQVVWPCRHCRAGACAHVRGGQAARSAAPLSLLTGGSGHIARAGANDDWGGRERGRAGMEKIEGHTGHVGPHFPVFACPVWSYNRTGMGHGLSTTSRGSGPSHLPAFAPLFLCA